MNSWRLFEKGELNGSHVIALAMLRNCLWQLGYPRWIIILYLFLCILADIGYNLAGVWNDSVLQQPRMVVWLYFVAFSVIGEGFLQLSFYLHCLLTF